MRSNIDLAEFKARLSKNTLLGNPNINGTPLVVLSLFYSSEHKFFGRINKSSFEITTNTTFRPVPYKIKGTASSASNTGTKVEYTIIPIWFGYLWIRIIPALCTCFIIVLMIANHNLIMPLGIFGSLFIFLSVLNIYRIKRRLRNFESDFKKTFEIT